MIMCVENAWLCEYHIGSVVSDTVKKITIKERITGEILSFKKNSNIVVNRCDKFPVSLDVVKKTICVLKNKRMYDEEFDTINDVRKYLKELFEMNCYTSFEEFIKEYSIEKKEILNFTY